MMSNFNTHGGNDLNTQGTPYDYHSIMHYGNKAFTRNGQETIVAKFDPNMKLGGSVLSYLDLSELNSKYQCHKGMGVFCLLFFSHYTLSLLG